MKNKKLITTVVAAALVAVVGIGSTLAYLQDETETKTNTFTIGNVDIDLDEPEWDPDDAENMIPGATVKKNPIVTNVGQTDAFIGVKVENILAMVEEGFVIGEVDANGKLAIAEGNVFEWDDNFTLVDKDGNEVNEGKDHALTLEELRTIGGNKLFFAYANELAVGAQTPALFDAVKLTKEADAVTKYLVRKYFVDSKGEAMTPAADGTYAEAPKKDGNGNYVYLYDVFQIVTQQDGTEGEVDVDANNELYTDYQAALDKIDELEAANADNTIEFNMNIQSAAIQSTNDEMGDAWKATTAWYPQLPADFLK